MCPMFICLSCTETVTDMKIGKSDIAMNTLRKYNLNRSKKAHFHIMAEALQRK